MYKDKDKQREAIREATRRYRAKGITKVSREQGITGCPAPDKVIPDGAISIGVLAEVDKACGDTVEHGLNDTIYPPDPKPQSHNPMMVGYVPPKEYYDP